MKKLTRWIKTIMIVLAFTVLMKSVCAEAATAEEPALIEASGDKTGTLDYRNIRDTLKEEGHIILESGKTYYIKATIWVKSNQSITATGATIISQTDAFRNKPTKTNYNSIKNFTVDGGIWKNVSKTGHKKTMVQFSHARDITIKNATIYCAYTGHAMEIIACKNVTIDSCKLIPLGKYPSNCVEEQLQIDIATPKTAPTLKKYGSQFVKGQTCQNITVTNCTITGARGLCTNYAAKEKKYQNKFHKNVVIKNCKITGKTSEAVALFNVIGATVENNTIITKSKRTGTAYSVGCHIAMFGKAPSSMSKAVYNVNNNTIKGGRQGFYVYSHSASKFGKIVAKNNKCYAKAGKEKAIWLDHNSVIKKTLKKNKMYKWK